MKCTTFYFSGTGNTRWAVREFTETMRKLGHQGAMVSIDHFENFSDEEILEILATSDYVGFANPIYGGDLPPIMRTFLNRLTGILKAVHTPGRRKPIYWINTVGYVNAFGPGEIKKLLMGTCLILEDYINIRVCNNAAPPLLENGELDQKAINLRLDLGRKEINRLAASLINGKQRIKGNGPNVLIGTMIRKMTPRAVLDFYLSLAVDPSKCNGCMTCVENCPTGSIVLEGDQLVFKNGCTACMRCRNFCPTGAVIVKAEKETAKSYYPYHGPEAGLF